MPASAHQPAPAGGVGHSGAPAPADEELLAHLLAAAPVVLVATDCTGILTTSEGRGLAGLGARPAEHVGRPLSELLGTGEGLAAALAAALRGEPASAVVEVAGSLFEASLAPLVDPSGRPAGAVGVAVDVTERAAATSALRARETLQDVVIDSLHEGVLVQDRDGRVTGWNASAQRILGLSRDQLAGARPVEDIVRVLQVDGTPFPDEHLPSRLAQTTGQPQTDVMVGIQRLDGSVVWLLTSSTPLPAAAGAAPQGVVSSFIDITDRLLAEQELLDRAAQLDQANAFKDELLAMTSHELRTPLAALLGYTTLLRTRGAQMPPAQRDEALDTMDKQARRLQRLVEDLLTMSRLRADAMMVSMGRVRPAELLARLPGILPSLVGDAEPVVRADPSLVAFADPMRLEQVMVNLLDNAVKHGAPPIEVDVVEVADAVEIRVRDHGPGVPAWFVPQMYDSFSQASTGTTRVSQGSGLGLAIVRGLVTAQEGEVRYEEAPGGGACFVLRLAAAPSTDT